MSILHIQNSVAKFTNVPCLENPTGKMEKSNIERSPTSLNALMRANLSQCSDAEIEAIKLALKHKNDLTQLLNLKENLQSRQGLSVGAIILLKSMAEKLHIGKALGKSRMGKLALWQIMARIIDQGSRLSAVRLATQHAVCDLLNLDSFTEDDLYENLDWLCERQQKIEDQLFKLRYQGQETPKLYLYDVTSSYLEGVKNELADWGYNRDGKKGKMQIVIGLLTDALGVPVSVEVFQGNTSDLKSFFDQIKKVAQRFRVQRVTMVGDRGMIKSAQIEALNEAQFHYITAITKPQIEKLIQSGLLQLALFSEMLCEVEQDGIRYILRRNPLRAEEIQKNRSEKLLKAEGEVEAQNQYLSEHPKAKVSVSIRKVETLLQKLKLSKFVKVTAEERELSLNIDERQKEMESQLDGCYVVKTDLDQQNASAEIVHQRYKDLAFVEHGFRTMKSGFLETRPIFVQKENRTRGHVFAVMLAYLITQELQKRWASLELTVAEGIEELSSLCSVEITVDKLSYQQIPQPRPMGKKLLELAEVTLPKNLPCKNVTVATRKKLTNNRKSL
jgi:transposase